MRDLFYKVLHHRACVPVCVGVGSVSAGLGAGYALGVHLTNKKHQRELREMADAGDLVVIDENQLEIDFQMTPEQVESAKEMWADLEKEKELEGERVFPTPKREESIEAHPAKGEPINYAAAYEKPERNVVLPHKPDLTPAQTNVFRVSMDWDQEAEEAQRTEDSVYILSKDEYFEHQREDDGYLQEQMVYFKGDDVLTDSSDIPQYDHGRMVGELRFGHGSGEDNIVYVRNPMLKMEYEISLDNGSYEHEILGEYEDDNHLSHSKDRPRKFRDE